MRPCQTPLSDLREASVANLTIGRMDPVHFIEEAAAAGLLLATATPRPVEHEIVGRPEVIRATKATLQSTGVRVLDVEAFTLSPRADIETYRPALEAGAELGATHISAVGTQWLGNTDFLEPAQAGGALRSALRRGGAVQPACRGRVHALTRHPDVGRRSGDDRGGGPAECRADRGRAAPVSRRHATCRAGRRAREPSRLCQFCDAVAGPPAPADLPAEARSTRLHLGDGVIPLHDILDVLPEHTPLVIETPVAAEAAWPTARRLQSAAADAQAFFQRHLTRKGTLAA
jgi:hypothetical protein